MRFARTMATLTARILGRLVPLRNAPEVRVPIEPKPNVWMAGLADHAADESRLGCRHITGYRSRRAAE
jgi:hypothetical protein